MKAIALFLYLYFMLNFSLSKNCLLRHDFDLKVNTIQKRGESSKTYLLVYSSTDLLEDLNKLEAVISTFLDNIIFEYECFSKSSSTRFSKGNKNKNLIVVIDKTGNSKYRSYKKINLKLVIEQLTSIEDMTNKIDFLSKSLK